MPIPFFAELLFNGRPHWMPEYLTLLKGGLAVGSAALLKKYSSGAANSAERNMHGRVVMMTGGTSGIGATVAYELGRRGAQIVFLTHLPPADLFLAEYIDELRNKTNNQMIYAEQVDLASLYSIRKFATKWIDNAPPRRLDMIILNAATLTPPGKPRTVTSEGIEETWMVNYLANFHLLGILSPALKAQPFDRDVRVIMTTCSSYITSPPLKDSGAALDEEGWSAGKAYAQSKLALMTFGQAFQKHLDSYKRPDELPMYARVIFADPGYSRTAGMRRWLSRGTIWGLIVYLVLYIFSWLFLKSAQMGAQSILFAAMEESLVRPPGGKLIKECKEVDFARKDIKDDEVAKKLWESSDQLIEKLEKEEVIRRAREKKEKENQGKKTKGAEQAEEIESLIGSIKKGKEAEAKQMKSRRKSKKAS
ncbi:putative retinol dehydrogenase 13 protein [Zalerion maritima]|uniref:Retinol dehydrogenase 13 protein n=1 Tax=Zalerion maritima TaxID=339359 RepID=A0AAD5WWV7_9PEZI|nr:putative retinol dehydrogenase 13 protein [Zalerion maritima]